MPHAALVHDHFTGPTGMGVVVGRHARWLLEAGWSVTLVGDNIPADLAQACDIIRVSNPQGLPALPEHLEWCRRAARALPWLRADLVHVHSPLLAAHADLVTSHFMSHPSHQRGAHELASGLVGALRRTQGLATRLIDHHAYRHLRSRTYISFVSEFLREEFETWYGKPRGGWVLTPPAPAWKPVAPTERVRARGEFRVAPEKLCVGYLGGADPRKGWPKLRQLQGADLNLLVAGPGSEYMEVAGRRGIGFVDVDAFHAACDVVVAPAVFDSAPVAVLQALARDIPVVTTAQCGWARAVARTAAGVIWDEVEPLEKALARAASTTTEARERCLSDFSEARQSAALLDAYSTVLDAPIRSRVAVF